VNDPLDAIVRRHAAIINEARATVAAGGELDTDALAERLVAAARRSAALRSPEQSEAIAAAERAARSQLERLVGVQKAKKRLGAEQVAPSATARPAPALPGRLQTRPTITGNMDVRRGEEAGELSLSWQAEAAVSSWEVRFSERPRPGADYAHSLRLLQQFGARVPGVPTKSGLMVGLGETDEEILQVMRDLRAHEVRMLTIGQYLAPSAHHLPVARYVEPAQFERYAAAAQALGFSHAASAPLVRSSYHADQQAHAAAQGGAA